MSRRLPLPGEGWTPERPDGLYAFVAGAYVAALLTPAAMFAVAQFVTGAAGLYVAFLAVLTVVTALAGLLVSRTRGLAVELGRREATRLLPAVALLWLVAIVGLAALEVSVPDGAVLLAGVSALAGTFVGFVLSTTSRNRYAAAWLADAETLAEWEARWPRRRRRGAIAIMISSAVLGGIGFLARFVDVLEPAGLLFPLFYVWPVLAGAVNPRTFTVTDAGLVTGRPLVKRFRPWSAIGGYALTDEALVIRQAGRWRPALRSDRDDVGDLDAVVAALEDATSNSR